MESTKLAKASLDDIVFEGRNRAYGAYLLRQLYNRHILIATVSALALAVLLLSIPLIKELIAEEEEVVVVKKVVTEVELAPPPPLDKAAPPPPPPPPPDLPPPPPPVRSTIKFTPPVVKKDAEVPEEVEEIPDAEELEETDAGTETIKGSATAPPDLGEIDGTGEVVAEVVEEKVYEYVEQMPTFPGGEGELLRYLGQNIKYPALAQRNNIQGTVYIKFTVNRDGSISDVEVLKPLGGGTEEEAVRVVKSMPKWAPGKSNGRAVAVKYTLPVRFSIK